MSSTGVNGGIAADGLRERLPNDPAKPQQAKSSESAQAAVKSLNDNENKTNKNEEEKRTYGRTPDGTGAFTLARAEQCASTHHRAYIKQYPSSSNSFLLPIGIALSLPLTHIGRFVVPRVSVY